MYEICVKNISNENCEKRRNCLFTTVLGKGLFASIKGYVCLTKGHLDISQKGRWRSDIPNQKLFLTLLIQVKEK